MFCKYCGNQIDDNAPFCSRCGKQVQGTPAEKTGVNLWLLLSIVTVLLLLLSVSLSLSWGDIPLSKLNIEDTIPSALLSIVAICVSGFNFFNEKKLKESNNGNSKKHTVSTLLFAASLFAGAVFVLLPLLGALS